MSVDKHLTNLTLEFATILCDWSPDDELFTMCRLLLLDGLAVAAAGAAEPGPTRLADRARQDGDRPVATVLGHGFATSPPAAARVNGASMHVLDFEPMWIPPNHALSPVLPGILALAERLEGEGSPPQGRRVYRALGKGIEAQSRLRCASTQLAPEELTLHPPGLVGPLAAATACADLLGLGEQETATAIGIAASRSGGVMANIGSMTKALHCGDAAAHGLESALLAGQGFTCGKDPLAGRHGFGHTYFGTQFDTTHLLQPIDVPRLIDPGPAWKLFPCQYATHFGITAALDLYGQIAHTDRIDKILLRVPTMPYIDRPFPATGLDGKFSWQYTVALALQDGRVNAASFSDERRFATDIEALLQRIHVVSDSTIAGCFDEMHVELTVILDDGTELTSICHAPLGSWSRKMEHTTLEAKAFNLIAGVAGPDKAQTILASLDCEPEQLRISDLTAQLHDFNA